MQEPKQKKAFFLFLIFLFSVLAYCQKSKNNLEIIRNKGAIASQEQPAKSPDTIQANHPQSKCEYVSGIKNGLTLKANFIMDSAIYLHLVFSNVSNKTIVFFPPFYYGNQGTRTLGFVEIIIPDSLRHCLKISSLFVTSFRSFWSEKLGPNDTVSYQYKVGICSGSPNGQIPFKLRYVFTKEDYEAYKSKLYHRESSHETQKYWFGEIITDSGRIVCGNITMTNPIYFIHVKK